MSDNPDIINMNFTSFAKKEAYKPPTTAFFGTTNTTKKTKYVPGGEWAQEDDEQVHSEPVYEPAKKLPGETNGAPKSNSKFGFIKDKKDKPKTEDVKVINSVGVLEFSEVRSDQ